MQVLSEYLMNKESMSPHEPREYPVSFSEWLSATRKSRGLTQQRLAELIEVSKPTVVRMEGGSKPRYNLVGRIALALGVEDVNSVFEIAGYEPPVKNIREEAAVAESKEVHLLQSINEKLAEIEALLQRLVNK